MKREEEEIGKEERRKRSWKREEQGRGGRESRKREEKERRGR